MAHDVIITGSAGRLGRAAITAILSRGYSVFGLDITATHLLPMENQIIGPLPEVEKLTRKFEGARVVFHLAATPDDAEFPRQSEYDNFESELVPNNIIAAYRVVEAARRAKVPRLVLASTGQVVDGHLRAGRIPVEADAPTDPRYLYACTKVFLEALGRTYARQHGMNIIAVRLGWCPRDVRQVKEIQDNALAQDVYFSPSDAGRFFTRMVEAVIPAGFHTIYATSRFTHRLRYDLSETERLVQFTPQDCWPDGALDFQHG